MRKVGVRWGWGGEQARVRQSSPKGVKQAIVNQTNIRNQVLQRQHWRFKCLEMGWSACVRRKYHLDQYCVHRPQRLKRQDSRSWESNRRRPLCQLIPLYRLSYRPLIVIMVSVDVKQHYNGLSPYRPLTVIMVSVDGKQHYNGLTPPNSHYGLYGRKATL